MPVRIRCSCGKQYRVSDNARGKRMRCKECGEELAIPSKPPGDDEFDLSAIDPNEAAADDEEGAAPAPRTGRSSKKSARQSQGSDGAFSAGDIAVRSVGLFAFLATLGNCAYQYSAAQGAAPQGQGGLPLDFFLWGVLPIPIGGLIGVYIAWVGQEPDPEARRLNRLGGLVKCGIGVGMIVLGAVLTFAVTIVAKQLAGIAVAFTGLMIGGAAVVVYGGLSALTGREFKTRQS